MYEAHHAPLAPRALFFRRLAHHFGFAAIVLSGSLAIGILGYKYLVGLGWIDSYLNAAMLLGGMGPIATSFPNRAGKIFAGLYALYAGMVVLVVAGILITPVFHRFLHRFHLEAETKQRSK